MLKFKICTKSNIVLWGIILINCLLLIQLELLRVTRSCSYSAWKSQLILPYFPHTKIVVGVGKQVRREREIERERSYVRIQPVNKIKLFFMCMWNRKQLYNKKKKKEKGMYIGCSYIKCPYLKLYNILSLFSEQWNVSCLWKLYQESSMWCLLLLTTQ